MDKNYYTMYGIGTSKYSVSKHDGVQTHSDGSAFYDIALFRNKKKMAAYIKALEKEGYKERGIKL